MGLMHIIHNIFNGLKHVLYPVVNFLYYNNEEKRGVYEIISRTK